MALPGHRSLDLFYPGEQADQSCDRRGTWHNFFVTCYRGRNSLWSASGCHGSVVSVADIHSAVLNHRRTQPGTLCLAPKKTKSRLTLLSLGEVLRLQNLSSFKAENKLSL